MIKSGILNPQLLSLLARIRHTNTLVIADRGFPFWPMIETIDISLIDDIPTTLQVLAAIKPNFNIGKIFMAEEFLNNNNKTTTDKFTALWEQIPVTFEPHPKFKLCVPNAIGLIRTGDTTQYANMIIESA